MISPQIQHREPSRIEAPAITAMVAAAAHLEEALAADPRDTAACPACDSQPGALCTSHSGTRPRRHDVHRARTAALASTS
ncbi:hypothetical protein [Streptomyces uncialis]|uniref:hypothetical protein n=1 Tax=Streptomyces uncialis TaxID=1048205 RepID=UPI002F90E02E|nr:hypothetical protein OG268_37110 [Streptomyces uncialis]